MMPIEFERFVSQELGVDWSILSTDADNDTYIACQRQLDAEGFTCNLVLQVLAVDESVDLESTIPTGAVTVSQRGFKPADVAAASVLLVDVIHAVSITQWIGYRFEATHVVRLVLSATTSDWPAVAGTVAALADSLERSAP